MKICLTGTPLLTAPMSFIVLSNFWAFQPLSDAYTHLVMKLRFHFDKTRTHCMDPNGGKESIDDDETDWFGVDYFS